MGDYKPLLMSAILSTLLLTAGCLGTGIDGITSSNDTPASNVRFMLGDDYVSSVLTLAPGESITFSAIYQDIEMNIGTCTSTYGTMTTTATTCTYTAPALTADLAAKAVSIGKATQQVTDTITVTIADTVPALSGTVDVSITLNADSVSCASDSDCSNDETCVDGTCIVEESTSCETDADCSDPALPVCSNGTCVAADNSCDTYADCGADEICVDSVCKDAVVLFNGDPPVGCDYMDDDEPDDGEEADDSTHTYNYLTRDDDPVDMDLSAAQWQCVAEYAYNVAEERNCISIDIFDCDAGDTCGFDCEDEEDVVSPFNFATPWDSVGNLDKQVVAQAVGGSPSQVQVYESSPGLPIPYWVSSADTSIIDYSLVAPCDDAGCNDITDVKIAAGNTGYNYVLTSIRVGIDGTEQYLFLSKVKDNIGTPVVTKTVPVSKTADETVGMIMSSIFIQNEGVDPPVDNIYIVYAGPDNETYFNRCSGGGMDADPDYLECLAEDDILAITDGETTLVGNLGSTGIASRELDGVTHVYVVTANDSQCGTGKCDQIDFAKSEDNGDTWTITSLKANESYADFDLGGNGAYTFTGLRVVSTASEGPALSKTRIDVLAESVDLADETKTGKREIWQIASVDGGDTWGAPNHIVQGLPVWGAPGNAEKFDLADDQEGMGTDLGFTFYLDDTLYVYICTWSGETWKTDDEDYGTCDGGENTTMGVDPIFGAGHAPIMHYDNWSNAWYVFYPGYGDGTYMWNLSNAADGWVAAPEDAD